MATIQSAIKLNDMMSAPLRSIIDGMNMMLSTWQDLDRETSSGLDVSGVEAIRAKLHQATDALDQMGNEQREFNREVQQGNDAVDGMTNKIMGALGAYASFQTVMKVVNLSDQLTQTTARLKMIVDKGSDVEELFDKITASANRSRASISQTADTVAKLSLNAGDAFNSNDETILFAENLNKLFAIAGTEQASIASASLQLTQALGSGVLRGEEFNAVFEAAPNIMQTVADYMDVPIGKLRQMAQDGQITANVVKNALLNATNDINKQFESMPMTWGQVWTQTMNNIYYASIPLLNVINWLANNISIIAPLVIGLGLAFAVFQVAAHWTQIAAFATSAYHAVVTFLSIGFGILTGNTAAASAAQFVYNSALLACPLTWILLLIIAVIAVIYAVVAAINKCKNTTISATGIITGAIAVAGAFILNVAIGVLNAIIQALWTIFVEPFLGIIEWIINVCNGGFDSFGDAVANLIGQIIGWFLSLGKVVTTIIDAIFGTSWTDGLSALQDKVTSWGKNENSFSFSAEERSAPLIEKRFTYSGAWDAGYDFGAGVEKSVGNVFGSGLTDEFSVDGLTQSIGSVPTFDEIATNTADTADALDIANENLKYLRDSAEQDTINRFTTAEIRVEMTNNNNVSSDMDIDGIIDHMVTGVNEAMDRVAEGVHG